MLVTVTLWSPPSFVRTATTRGSTRPALMSLIPAASSTMFLFFSSASASGSGGPPLPSLPNCEGSIPDFDFGLSTRSAVAPARGRRGSVASRPGAGLVGSVVSPAGGAVGSAEGSDAGAVPVGSVVSAGGAPAPGRDVSAGGAASALAAPPAGRGGGRAG